MIPFPTYISLDVPEPFAARITGLRRTFDPDFADLPVEIAMAGSSGLGIISGDSNLPQAINAVNRIAGSNFPITTKFSRAAWFDDLRVYGLEVEAVDPLLSLHNALHTSGLTFSNDVPGTFHPHCALRWCPQWMNREQDKAWNALVAPAGDFVLRDLVLYGLPPCSGNAMVIHRVALGS